LGQGKRTSDDQYWTVMFVSDPDKPVRVFRVSKYVIVLSVAILLVAGLASLGFWHHYEHIRTEAARASATRRILEARERRLVELEARLGQMEERLTHLFEIDGQLTATLDLNAEEGETPALAASLTEDRAATALRGGPESPAGVESHSDEELEVRFWAASAVIDQSMDHLDEARAQMSEQLAGAENEPHLWPVTDGHVTSNFGWRVHPTTGRWDFHRGIDVAAPTGTPIVATTDGVVRFAGRLANFGETIRLRHGGKYETVYAHCHEIAVEVGDRVEAGEVIAYIGETGRATGPHVHYEVRVDGEPINPEPYLPR